MSLTTSALWPYVVLILVGFLPNEVWRWLGFAMARGIDEGSEIIVWVRAVATALVMAVTAKLIVFPTGTLALSPLWLRLAAAGIGFAVFLLTGKRVAIGVLTPIAILVAGLLLLQP